MAGTTINLEEEVIVININLAGIMEEEVEAMETGVTIIEAGGEAEVTKVEATVVEVLGGQALIQEGTDIINHNIKGEAVIKDNGENSEGGNHQMVAITIQAKVEDLADVAGINIIGQVDVMNPFMAAAVDVGMDERNHKR